MNASFWIAVIALSMIAISPSMSIRWRVVGVMVNVFVIFCSLLRESML